MILPVLDGAILQCSIAQVQNQQIIENVIHYRLAVNPSAVVNGSDVIDLMIPFLQSAAGNIADVMKSAFAGDWQFTGIIYQWIYPARFIPITSTTNQGPGLAAFPFMPANVGTTLTKYSVDASRHGRGSMHFAGMTAADVSGGIVSAGRVATMNALGARLTTVVDVSAVPGAISMTPIIFNRATPENSARWENYNPEKTSRVNRRRTVGVGI